MIKQEVSTPAGIGVGLLIFLGISALCYGVFTTSTYNWQWERAEEAVRYYIIRGWFRALLISSFALVLSVLIGALLMLGRRSPFIALRAFCAGYIELVRGTPLLVQLLLGYYILARSIPVPEWVKGDLVVGTVLLSLFAGAYLAEIFRGGVDSIEKSQVDAARAVGFSKWQCYRYVIIPQALRRVLPATTGQFVDLVKNSSLLGVIGITEIYREAENAAAMTYGHLEAYVPMAIAYLVITIPLSALAHYLERRLKYEN